MQTSWTHLSTFSCKRRGEYAYVRRIEPNEASDLALVYGAAVHLGLKTLVDNYTLVLGDEAAERGVDAFDEAFPKPEEPDKKGLRTQESGRQIIRAFRDQWLSRYPWEDEEGEKRYAIELPREHVYVAIIDRRGKLMGTKTLIEFKTTAWPHLFTIDPNTQVEGQSAVLEGNGIYGYRDVLFLLIHLHKDAKDGLIIHKKKGLEPDSIFRPMPTTLNDFKLDEWEKDVVARIEAIQRCYENGYFPKETEHCGDFGGCPYKRLCVLGSKEERELVIQTSYKEKPKREAVIVE
jgi:hypothetical protein